MSLPLLVGFGFLVVAILLGILVIAVLNSEGSGFTQTEADAVSGAGSGQPLYEQHSIGWRIDSIDEDSTGIPHSRVYALVDGQEIDTGYHAGTCTDLKLAQGIDGTGLLEGELAGIQCYFAGGGDELGAFLENGRIVIKQGVLDEGSAETPGFRGNFKPLSEIQIRTTL